MGRRNDHSRREIREMALKAARDVVDSDGSLGLSARRIAHKIGYTVGTLYLVFSNLDDLVGHLNTQTLRELRRNLKAAARRADTPRGRIKKMAAAYIRYATRHPNRWRLVFEHRMPEGKTSPQEMTAEIKTLFDMVEDLLREIGDWASDEELKRRATALWSGVHGVCVLTITDKLHVGGVSSVSGLADTLIDGLIGGDNP